MARTPLLPVAEALSRITGAMQPVAAETIALPDAPGRILAVPVVSRRTQPPFAMSAMDGYAVRAADVAKTPTDLKLIGEAPAGNAFAGTVGPGEAVRIFTGGPVPQGADAIIIQENTERDGDRITILKGVSPGTYIRPEGLDFREGDSLLQAGKRLGARDIALAAAMNVPWLSVRRRPRIALLATGDELVRPGEPIGPQQIVTSNNLGLAGIIARAGGEAIDLGIAPDNREALAAMAAGARGADMLITLGGASVGDHDLVQSVLGEQGLVVDFWRIAMRPGKPLIFGRVGDTPMIGLPGNPVSALVCGLIFVQPAIAALLDDRGRLNARSQARLGCDLPQNDERQDYLRASLALAGDNHPLAGEFIATPFERQDSSMLSSLARADCLVIRPPHAVPAKTGDRVDILQLEDI